MAILSDKDWDFFKENGYVVVPDAAAPENLEAIIAGVFEFLEMDPTDREGWYREPLLIRAVFSAFAAFTTN